MFSILRYIFQFLILCSVYMGGNYVAYKFHLPLPGSIVGMILLFLMLMFGLCKMNWVEEIANLHLKHLPLFFIPPIIGTFLYVDHFAPLGFELGIVIIVSSLLVLLVTATSVDYFERKKGR